MTKKAELEQWMRQKGIFATHEVIRWGSENYCNRADRYKRDFMQEGKVRKLTDFEKKRAGYRCKDSVYIYVPTYCRESFRQNEIQKSLF